jgi:hypothetical protein
MTGIEGEGHRIDPTPQQTKPTEQLKPQQEGGNGSPGLPPTLHERAKPPPESKERQPLPSVLDILERRAQLYESKVRELYLCQHKSKHTREYLALRNEHLEKVMQLGNEVASHYPQWTDRYRLIFDLYSTSVGWRWGLSTQKTQEFIAKVQPMPEEELAEELRTVKAAEERKAAIAKKISETQRRNRSLTPEERDRLQKEKDRERSRAYQRRKKERGLQAVKQRPTQLFPPPTQE